MSQHPQTQSARALDPNLTALIFIVNFIIIGGLIFSTFTLAAPTVTPTPTPSAVPTDLPTVTSTPQVVADSGQTGSADTASVSYDPALVEQGRQLFTLCSACHGPDARGIPNLGKDLVESEFVAAQTDDALVQFIITGRPIWDPLNTTGIDMPGKGGNPAMTTEDIQAIVAYLRTLSAQHSGQAEAAPVSNTSTSYDPAVVTQGEALFAQCAACHGPDARGIPNLGKDLVESEFVAGLTDAALLEFVKTGRPIWDPLNTTGIDMPGKGGNPALTDEQLLAIIAYIRSLSASAGG